MRSRKRAVAVTTSWLLLAGGLTVGVSTAGVRALESVTAGAGSVGEAVQPAGLLDSTRRVAADAARGNQARRAAAVRASRQRPAQTPRTASPITAADLTPTPAQALGDKPHAYLDGCHAAAATLVARACVYGRATAPVRVLVLGDSHAAQWQGALELAAAQRNWVITWLTKSGCPAADVHVLSRGTPFVQCDQWRRSALSVSARGPAYDLVVLASWTGHEITARPGSPVLTGAARARTWSAGVRRTVATLTPHARRVVWLRDTPRMRVDVPGCVLDHPRDLHACATPRATAQASPLWPAEWAAVSGLSRAGAVDLTATICGTSWCEVAAGRVLRWRDSGHLTNTYSRVLAPTVGVALAKELR